MDTQRQHQQCGHVHNQANERTGDPQSMLGEQRVARNDQRCRARSFNAWFCHGVAFGIVSNSRLTLRHPNSPVARKIRLGLLEAAIAHAKALRRNGVCANTSTAYWYRDALDVARALLP